MTRDEERAIEWDCQKVWRQYYHYSDNHEFEKALDLCTEDVTWLDLKGREEIVEALHAAMGSDTIRHVTTNMVVTVIDENHAEARAYNTIHYARDALRRDMDGPIPFMGPNRLIDHQAEFRRVGDDWQIVRHWVAQAVFNRPNEWATVEKWTEERRKTIPSS